MENGRIKTMARSKYNKYLIHAIGILNINGESLPSLSKRFQIPLETLRSMKKRGFGIKNFFDYRHEPHSLFLLSNGMLIQYYRTRIKFKGEIRSALVEKK